MESTDNIGEEPKPASQTRSDTKKDVSSADKPVRDTPNYTLIMRDNCFDPDLLSANLLFCSDDDDVPARILVKNWARAQRLLIVKRRWYYLPLRDWLCEMKLLVKSLCSDKKEQAFVLWGPFQECLDKFQTLLDIEDMASVQIKRDMIKFLDRVAKEKTKEMHDSIMELEKAEYVVLSRTTWKLAREAIDHDCSIRGSLTLGMVDLITSDLTRRKFSGAWSWADAF